MTKMWNLIRSIFANLSQSGVNRKTIDAGKLPKMSMLLSLVAFSICGALTMGFIGAIFNAG